MPEIDADGRDVSVAEAAVDELAEEARLADAGVAQEEELEEVVVVHAAAAANNGPSDDSVIQMQVACVRAGSCHQRATPVPDRTSYGGDTGVTRRKRWQAASIGEGETAEHEFLRVAAPGVDHGGLNAGNSSVVRLLHG